LKELKSDLPTQVDAKEDAPPHLLAIKNRIITRLERSNSAKLQKSQSKSSLGIMSLQAAMMERILPFQSVEELNHTFENITVSSKDLAVSYLAL
jgi:hypothetical protein